MIFGSRKAKYYVRQEMDTLRRNADISQVLNRPTVAHKCCSGMLDYIAHYGFVVRIGEGAQALGPEYYGFA
jgi:hypothetical protein